LFLAARLAVDKLKKAEGAKLMKSIFSKKCHVVGRQVFDHLPYDQIQTCFPIHPPTQLIEMYRTFGRGTLCDMFTFCTHLEAVSLDSWTGIRSDEGCDREVYEVMNAGTRLGIGYGASGNYYILDFDRDDYVMRENLEELLLYTIDERWNIGPAHFPFFITAAASSRTWEVRVGESFFDQCCAFVSPETSIRYFFNYQGMHILFFDHDARFMAAFLSGKSLELGLPRLTLHYDKESSGFDVSSVFKILTDISAGEFQVEKEVF